MKQIPMANELYQTVSDVERLFDADSVDDRDLLLCEAAVVLAREGHSGKAFGLSQLIVGGYERWQALDEILKAALSKGDQDDSYDNEVAERRIVSPHGAVAACIRSFAHRGNLSIAQ
ncbi:MAG: hypothetical protein IPK58_24575 [Acidobacteria bacterium]|nr:hypothetical protein [Acidobacteriota bacterium]